MDNLKRVRKSPESFNDKDFFFILFMSCDCHMLWYCQTKWGVLSLLESLLGQLSVPFDLVKKQPKGQQTFALMTKDMVTGSLTTDVRP